MNKDEYTISEKMLDVGDGHTLYVQEWGSPDAPVPVIFLHGGPGSQIKDKHKRPFDPKTHRVIFFDQRGCGKSTPYGSIDNNNTDKLVEDVSKVADAFNAKTFILHGSSWGSTLALSYSLANPERVFALVIGGIFTGSRFESSWIDEGNFKTFFPEVWQAFLDKTSAKHHDHPAKYHFDKVINGTAKEQKLSSYAYNCLESGVAKLDDRQSPENFEDYDPTSIRIEMHYLANDWFLPERYILDNVHKLKMPVHIVQGRYDMVCPPITAYELHSSLPDSKIYWTQSGHKHEHEGENIFRSIFNSIA